MGGKTVLDKFLHQIKVNFDPEVVILFGSRARGVELKNSDFDLIIVSEKFQGLPFLDRISAIYEFWELEQGLDVLGYTPEEFDEKKRQIGIVAEALKQGMKLYQKRSRRRNSRGKTL